MKKITLLFILSLITQYGLAQQGFESTTGPNPLPSTIWTLNSGITLNGDWAVFDNGVGTGVRWDINNFLPYQGVNAAYCNRENIGAGNTSEDYLATPAITIPPNGQLKFWTRHFLTTATNTIYETRIKLVSTSAQNIPSGYVIIPGGNWTDANLNTVATTYEEKTVTIPAAFIGQPVYIAFVMKYQQPGSVASSDRWLIDEIKVVQQCFAPTAPSATSMAGGTSANLGWTAPAGGGVAFYEIENGPIGFIQGTGTINTSNTTSYTQTGLNGLFNYCFYVRANCGTGNYSSWVGPTCYTTTALPPVCGGNYVDSGGIAANYSNNSNLTQLISPVTAGDAVSVTFTGTFDINPGDNLKIYSGNSAVAPSVLIATLTGNALPGNFTSSAPGGQLFFVFTSDATITASGWTSDITCGPRPTCPKPINLIFTATPIRDVSAEISWTEIGAATSWQVLAVPCNSSTIPTSGWQTATSTPFIVTGLSPRTCYKFYVRAVCSPTSNSDWAGSIDATTTARGVTCSLPIDIATLPYSTTDDTANYQNLTSVSQPAGCLTPATTLNYMTGNDVFYSYTPTVNETISISMLPGADWSGIFVYAGCTNVGLTCVAGAANAGSGVRVISPLSVTAGVTYVIVISSNAGPQTISYILDINRITCSSPLALSTSNISQTTALLNWTQPLNPDGSTVTEWQLQVLPSGSPAPTATSTAWTTLTSITNPYFTIGLSSGTCYNYYVRAICSLTNTSLISGPFSFCTLIPNDECSGAILVPVNQNTNCLQTVQGTLSNATASIQGNICAPPASTDDNDDVWFYFTATSTSHYISLLGVNYTATPTGLVYGIYSGICPNLTQIGGCVNNSSTPPNPILTGLTVGTRYYIRVYSSGNIPVNTVFELCIGTNVGNCTNALPLCAINPIIIPNNVGVPNLPNPISPFSATSAAVGCLGSAPSPTFYYLQIPTNGNYSFLLEQNSSNTFAAPGTGIDVDFIAWGPYASNAAACAAITTSNAPGTGNSCSYSSNFTETFIVNNAIAGDVYLVMITNFNGRKGFVRITQNTGPGPTVCCPFGNFTYSSTFYCQNAANPSPSFVSNAVAGTFTYTTTGTGTLSLNPTTGLITLATSSPGVYVINNTILANGTCPSDIDSWTLTITAPPLNSNISYSAPTYCKSDATTYSVTQSGSTGGTYTVAPVGLGLNLTTGAVTPNTSTAAGTYVVTYNLPSNGGCPGAQATATINIINTPSAGIISGNQNICLPGSSALATTGNGGSWSSSNNLVATVNSVTGLVTGISAGTTTITYTAIGTGGCSNSTSTTTINVYNSAISGVISGNQLICLPPGSTSQFSTTGTGGTWTIAPTSIATINASTGLITAVAAGNATVTYTVIGTGSCPTSTSTRTVTVSALPIGGVLSGNQLVCVGNTETFSSTISGGVWTITAGNAFASINSTTGVVTGISTGTATITYIVTGTGSCAGATSVPRIRYAAVYDPGVITGIQGICLPGTSQLTTTGSGGGWSSSNTNIATVNAAGLVTGVAAGQVTISYSTPPSNCSSTKILNVYNAPTAGVLSGSQTICAGNTTTFLSTILGGVWSAPAGSLIASINASTGVVTGLSAGTETVTYTVPANGSCTIAIATRTINIIALPTAPTGINQTVCQSNPIQTLTASATAPAGSSVVWYDAATLGNVVVNPTLNAVGTVTYFAESLLTAGGCKSASRTPVVLTINPTPLTPVSGGNQSVCQLNPIQTLTATAISPTGSTTVWYNAATLGAIVANPTLNVVGSITYFAQSVTTTGNCNSTTRIPVTLEIKPTPLAPIGNASQVFCATANPTITNLTVAGPNIKWYSALSGGTTIPTTTPLTNGTHYYASQTNALGCESFLRLDISAVVIPAFAITATGACQGAAFVLNVIPTNGTFTSGTTFNWTGPSNFSNTSQSPTALQPGIYNITVTEPVGNCQTSSSITIDNISCVIQHGISPNNDGANDNFDLTAYKVKTINIYNRYGRKEYSSDNYTNQWYGQTANGEELPDGTYYYQIERQNGESISGWVYINRENK